MKIFLPCTHYIRKQGCTNLRNKHFYEELHDFLICISYKCFRGTCYSPTSE